MSENTTVHLHNFTDIPFSGWVRATIDWQPNLTTGKVGNIQYAVGRRIGLNTYVIDLNVSLAPGQKLNVDLSNAVSSNWVRGPLPADPISYFGGPAKFGGVQMGWVGLEPDGAGYTAHLSSRKGFFVANLWLTWYPDRPQWCKGEVVVTASNPRDTSMHAVAQGHTISFGDAIVWIPGIGGFTVVPDNTSFADGQARAVPIVLAWLRHIQDSATWASIGADAILGVGGTGIKNLLYNGNPPFPTNFNVVNWANSKFAESAKLLHTWNGALIGPNTKSGDTGAQEDQVFTGGETILPNGIPALMVNYLASLKMAARPCHHLEFDGKQVDVATHINPRLIMWDGRAHWHTGVSPDQLGKPRALTPDETNGWWGPDVEHLLYNRLSSSAKTHPSKAIQWILSMQARIYLAQWTTTPGWSTSQPYASRAVGWEGIMAVHLYLNLEDRLLADRVRLHWITRANSVLIPQLGNRPGNVWDVRTDDPRVGPGSWWMSWQQSIGAYGLNLAGEVFNHPQARELARLAAERCLAESWQTINGKWWGVANIPFIGGNPYQPFNDGWIVGDPPSTGQPTSGPRFTGPDWWSDTWNVPAVAVVLRHNPNNTKAKSIWSQISQSENKSWIPPGIIA